MTTRVFACIQQATAVQLNTFVTHNIAGRLMRCPGLFSSEENLQVRCSQSPGSIFWIYRHIRCIKQVRICTLHGCI